MIRLLEQHRAAVGVLCRKYGVARLELFGSAARDGFDPANSDVDFFCEFDANPRNLADCFFGPLEDLQQLLGRPVDLVSARDATNPCFLRVANQHRVSLYEPATRREHEWE